MSTNSQPSTLGPIPAFLTSRRGIREDFIADMGFELGFENPYSELPDRVVQAGHCISRCYSRDSDDPLPEGKTFLHRVGFIQAENMKCWCEGMLSLSLVRLLPGCVSAWVDHLCTEQP